MTSLVLDALSALTTEDKPIDPFATPTQLDGDLITLTLLPRSRWQTLLNLEVIQVCRPCLCSAPYGTKEYVCSKGTSQKSHQRLRSRRRSSCPPFLALSHGLLWRIRPPMSNRQKNPGVSTRAPHTLRVTSTRSWLVKRRMATVSARHFFAAMPLIVVPDESFFNYVKTLSPAAIDLELRTLVTIPAIRIFLNALRQRLLYHRDFEAAQTFLSVFLQIHSDVLVANSELHGELKKLKEIQQKESGRVLELISSSLGTLSFLRDNM